MSVGALPWFSPAEWTALAALITALATVALVIVTFVYVNLTRNLATTAAARLRVGFDARLEVFYWTGHPEGHGPDRHLGPIPELLRIRNLGAPVLVHSVEFSTRWQPPRTKGVGGQVGPVEPRPPHAFPTWLKEGETVDCEWSGGVWAMSSEEEEATVAVEYSREERGKHEVYTQRGVVASNVRRVPVGR